MDNYLMKKWLFTDAPENLPELADQLYLILFNLLTFLDKLKRLILQFWTEHICQLFHVLAQFFFTTSETQLDYCHQKINVRVSLQVAEWLKT